MSLGLLQKKCESGSTLKEFRRLVQHIADQDREHGHMPGYAVALGPDDAVVFRNRGSVPRNDPAPVRVPPLDPETYHEARTVAPGWDVYELEREWREWITEPPNHPDAAFVGFCKT